MHVLLLLLVPVQPMKQGDKDGKQKRERGRWSQEETNEASQISVEMISFRKAKARQGRAMLPSQVLPR